MAQQEVGQGPAATIAIRRPTDLAIEGTVQLSCLDRRLALVEHLDVTAKRKMPEKRPFGLIAAGAATATGRNRPRTATP